MNIRQFLSDNFNFIKSEFFILLAALIAPTIGMLFVLGALIIVDTLSGVYAALKLKGWGGVKSRTLSNGLLPKLVFYPLAILICQAIENEFSELPIMRVTGFIIMSIEFKSIGENYKAIFRVSIFKEFKSFMSKK